MLLLNYKKFFNNSKYLVFCLGLTFSAISPPPLVLAAEAEAKEGDKDKEAEGTLKASESSAIETSIDDSSVFSRAWRGGFVVFMVLLLLVAFSIVTWGVVIAKLIHLFRIDREGQAFIKSFWDSRSLNDLNAKLAEYEYSPVREVFRSGYSELVRGSQMRDQASSSSNPLVVKAAVENLTRALEKAKVFERRKMEKYLQILSISASSSPFIGLFGTVWGIMSAFEGIARSGSASLAAVAPGISEALIATAFGLAAAIPAVIGYNLSAARIRYLLTQIDGFISDFLNIVERYLVTDRHDKHKSPVGPSAAERS